MLSRPANEKHPWGAFRLFHEGRGTGRGMSKTDREGPGKTVFSRWKHPWGVPKGCFLWYDITKKRWGRDRRVKCEGGMGGWKNQPL